MYYTTSSLLFSLSIIIGMLGFLLHVSAEEPELQLFNYDDYADVLRTYVDEKDRAFLTQERYDIKYLKYDWSLNEQKKE